MKYIVSVIAVLMSFSLARAQIITDRPDFADAATPVPVGVFQVESGYLFGKTRGTENHTSGQILVKTGVSEKMEVRLGLNSYEKEQLNGGDNSGFSDGYFGVKFRLLEGKAETGPGSFNLSTIIFTGLPYGSDDFRSKHLTPGAMLTADMALSERWTWAPFVQYTLAEDAVAQYDELSAGFSFVRSLGQSSGWYVEYYTTIAENFFREDKNYLGTGFTHLLSDEVQLDIYGGSALNGETPDYFIGGGISFMIDFGE